MPQGDTVQSHTGDETMTKEERDTVIRMRRGRNDAAGQP